MIAHLTEQTAEDCGRENTGWWLAGCQLCGDTHTATREGPQAAGGPAGQQVPSTTYTAHFQEDQQHRRGPVLPQPYPKPSPEEGDFSSQTQIHSGGFSCSKALLYAFGFLTLVSTDIIPI